MSNLSSRNICSELFDVQKMQDMSLPRLKKFKSACYKAIGNRFFCCEFRCEYLPNFTDDPDILRESKYADNNLENINKIMASKS